MTNEMQIEYEHLRQYEKLLNSSAVVSKTDLAGNITYVNDEFCKVTGYSRDELLGKNHRIIKHPENNRVVFKELWETIKAKKIWKGVIRNLAKDGRAYYVKSTIMPIMNDKNEIIEYIAARKV